MIHLEVYQGIVLDPEVAVGLDVDFDLDPDFDHLGYSCSSVHVGLPSVPFGAGVAVGGEQIWLADGIAKQQSQLFQYTPRE